MNNKKSTTPKADRERQIKAMRAAGIPVDENGDIPEPSARDLALRAKGGSVRKADLGEIAKWVED